MSWRRLCATSSARWPTAASPRPPSRLMPSRPRRRAAACGGRLQEVFPAVRGVAWPPGAAGALAGVLCSAAARFSLRPLAMPPAAAAELPHSQFCLQGGTLIRMVPERAGHSIELQVGGLHCCLDLVGSAAAQCCACACCCCRCFCWLMLFLRLHPAQPTHSPPPAPRSRSGPPCRSSSTTGPLHHTTSHTCWGALH